ncbi:sensor histidine kinase [Salibacterium aidingense]|uniref:sensor histidine kinase n=1 Tax=Salibacterium aidingense TaxID=384933 RepID=UPI003BBD1E4F
MTIRRRLILSNIAMIVLPILGFLFLEIVLGWLLFTGTGTPDERNLSLFLQLRWIGVIVILVGTNGLLTYYVSKSIIQPVKHLTLATRQIADGKLDVPIEPEGRDEIGDLAQDFEEMRRKLKEADELQKKYEWGRQELVASISHDLKTPITSIKGYIEGIRDGVTDSPEKLNRYVETIHRKAKDMDRLIEELFLYSKLNVNRVPFHFEKVDMHAFLQDYLEELEFDYPDVTFSLSPKEAEPFFARADREQMKRVVTNIIQNSLKYMDKVEKTITVQLEKKQSNLQVTVEDNGRGIPEADLPHIFHHFYRVDSSRHRSSGGSGLGLAIVKNIVEEHGGNISVSSTEEKGTCIAFTLKNQEGSHEPNINY